MPTATAPLLLSRTLSARRPELVVGSVDASPESCMILTMFDTVAVESPVWRASSAWVEGPLSRHSMIRCWFRCRRADCDPGFLVRLLVERDVEGMLRRVHHRRVVVKKLTQRHACPGFVEGGQYVPKPAAEGANGPSPRAEAGATLRRKAVRKPRTLTQTLEVIMVLLALMQANSSVLDVERNCG